LVSGISYHKASDILQFGIGRHTIFLRIVLFSARRDPKLVLFIGAKKGLTLQFVDPASAINRDLLLFRGGRQLKVAKNRQKMLFFTCSPFTYDTFCI